jgi:cysteate synthase
LIIIPDSALDRMRFVDDLHPCVRLIALVGGTYTDAMALAATLAELPGYQAEGGVRNVARRDGLGTVLLAAYEAMGELPDYYFQAVGSGAGAIGVYETAVRLRGEGAGRPPRIVMCQNLPFAPIHAAWTDSPTRAGTPLIAPELANSKPPYTTLGGVRDCLTASEGAVLAVDNAAAHRAMREFEQLCGIDIEPGAGVALACLRLAVDAGRVPRDARILLNVTGGGRARYARDHALVPAEPTVRVQVPRGREFPSTEDMVHVLSALDRGDDFVGAR